MVTIQLAAVAVLGLVVAPLAAQTADVEAFQDAVLRGIKNINVAHVVPMDSWATKAASADDLTNVMLETLRRYKLPITAFGLRPVPVGDKTGYQIPPTPALALSITTATTGNSRSATIALELWDSVLIERNPKLQRSLVIWNRDTDLQDPPNESQALRSAVASLVEHFCLSYLAAQQ